LPLTYYYREGGESSAPTPKVRLSLEMQVSVLGEREALKKRTPSRGRRIIGEGWLQLSAIIDRHGAADRLPAGTEQLQEQVIAGERSQSDSGKRSQGGEKHEPYLLGYLQSLLSFPASLVPTVARKKGGLLKHP